MTLYVYVDCNRSDALRGDAKLYISVWGKAEMRCFVGLRWSKGVERPFFFGRRCPFSRARQSYAVLVVANAFIDVFG